MHIRKASYRDIKQISQLLCQLTKKYIFPECTEEGSNILLKSMQPDAIKGYFEAGYVYHLAEVERTIIGVIGIKKRCHLYHLFVADSFQHQGIATELWHMATKTIDDVVVFSVNSSKVAVPFYQSLGFELQSGLVVDNGISSFPMSLILESS